MSSNLSTLHACFDETARRDPAAIAVVDPAGSRVTYGELKTLSDRVRDLLVVHGVRPGDRVGICMSKSIESVAAALAIMKAGAAYVPVDAEAPPSRSALILSDCNVAAVFVEPVYQPALREHARANGKSPVWIPVAPGDGSGFSQLLAAASAAQALPASQPALTSASVAYILYTSGSTGRPKGVTLTHRAARSFVDWSVDTFAPSAADVFSSHAPFHFDLSVFDLYVCFAVGGRLVLLGEAMAKEPLRLADLIAAERISIWYSAPSILSMLAQVGKLSEHDLSALRTVLFAGEVFPIAYLRLLTEQLPGRRYVNLYGPTETNVCTYHEAVLPIAPDRTTPLPIGRVCENLKARVVDEQGADSARGTEGELVIAGPNLMSGYFGRPDLDARAFLDVGGERYYRTGDLVVEPEDGELVFRGRRDRMVKRRGFRVELGEIEACLYRHPDVREAAVIAVPAGEGALQIHAHLVSLTGDKLSSIGLRTFCSEHVPVYMIPDSFRFHPALPRTSTGKTDYQILKTL